jgi:acyl-CoA dehydrogenase
MSEQRRLLVDTTERVLSRLERMDTGEAWAEIERAGLQAVLLPEDKGGFGGGFEDARVVFHACGRHAVALPLGEAILASRLISDAELIVPDGSLSLAPDCRGRVRSGKFTGAMRAVPFGDQAGSFAGVLEDRGVVAVVVAERAAGEQIELRHNAADESRSTIQFEAANVQVAPLRGWNAGRLYRSLALVRACQIAGAIDAALALSVTYARERVQFGRPLAAFQAIQQQLAVLAEECAAANSATQAACRAADLGEAQFEIAAAKLRANIAAATAASIAHQVHGAIGFTAEYSLQRFTRRMWAWRSEFGNDRYWANEIGARVAARGADAFWPDLVGG